MEAFLDQAALLTLFQVIMIDLALAGDNAIVIGLAAAGLPKEQRPRVILIGIIAATVLRIIFTLFTVQLLKIIGLQLAGGLLLLWVCWKMWKELRDGHSADVQGAEGLSGDDISGDGKIAAGAPTKTFKAAVLQIIIADVSMSLDNVLAVAGAAKDHLQVMIFGLILSIALMGLAANFVAKLLAKYHWIGYLGLAIIFYVALKMIYHGGDEVLIWQHVDLGGWWDSLSVVLGAKH